MREELVMMGPEHWIVPDLDGPTEDCVMPDPVRPPDSCGVWHTCSHCGVTFILVQQSDGESGWFERWVDDRQHNQMNRARERMYGAEEGDPYWRPRQSLYLQELPHGEYEDYFGDFKDIGPIEPNDCEVEE